jgi:hypothetical protein
MNKFILSVAILSFSIVHAFDEGRSEKKGQGFILSLRDKFMKEKNNNNTLPNPKLSEDVKPAVQTRPMPIVLQQKPIQTQTPVIEKNEVELVEIEEIKKTDSIEKQATEIGLSGMERTKAWIANHSRAIGVACIVAAFLIYGYSNIPNTVSLEDN